MGQKGSVWVVILAIIASLSLAGGAYLYGQNQTLKSGVKPQQIFNTTTPITNQTPIAVFPTSSSQAKKPTVIFEAEGSFTIAEKDELKKKVINPFVDYYEMENTGQVLLTLTISKNNQASKTTYPYQGQAIFQGGGNMGFLIMKVGSGVDWWFPECLMGCNLSSAYKLKYPEIAAKVQ